MNKTWKSAAALTGAMLICLFVLGAAAEPSQTPRAIYNEVVVFWPADAKPVSYTYAMGGGYKPPLSPVDFKLDPQTGEFVILDYTSSGSRLRLHRFGKDGQWKKTLDLDERVRISQTFCFDISSNGDVYVYAWLPGEVQCILHYSSTGECLGGIGRTKRFSTEELVAGSEHCRIGGNTRPEKTKYFHSDSFQHMILCREGKELMLLSGDFYSPLDPENQHAKYYRVDLKTGRCLGEGPMSRASWQAGVKEREAKRVELHRQLVERAPFPERSTPGYRPKLAEDGRSLYYMKVTGEALVIRRVWAETSTSQPGTG